MEHHEKRADGGEAGKEAEVGGGEGREHRARGGMAKMKNMGAEPGLPNDKDGDEMKRGGHKRRARGGGAREHVQLYNAPDSNEMHEAEDETPGFKRGGKHEKRKHGGMAEGKMEHERLDRRPRRAAGGKAGNTPYSSASAMTAPESGMNGRGFESSGPAKK
jgi:hypothetical protein